MALFQCVNPDCLASEGAYVFNAKLPICDKCGAKPPLIGTVVIMHYAHYHSQGNLKGYMGKKARIACSSRAPASPFNCYTNYFPLVNCPDCIKTDAYKAVWSPDPENPMDYFNDPNIVPELANKNTNS